MRQRTFILSVSGARLKAEVRIYPTHRGMLSAIRKDYAKGKMSGVANDTVGYCSTYEDILPHTRFAIVYLCEKHLTPGIVAHELLHAALALMARRRRPAVACSAKDAAPGEEELCDIVEQLVDGLRKKRLVV